MGLSRTVSEINGDFGRKSQIFPSHELKPTLRLFFLEFYNAGWLKKNTAMLLPVVLKSLIIGLLCIRLDTTVM